jgi:hypothetical protein
LPSAQWEAVVNISICPAVRPGRRSSSDRRAAMS